MSNYIDITGQRFGKLVAIKFHSRGGRAGDNWFFRCDCGKTGVWRKGNIVCKSSKTKNCGCVHKKWFKENRHLLNFRHGFAKKGKVTRFYRIWLGIKTRCLNEKIPRFFSYGGRGITVCDSWLKFENFRNDMYGSYLEHSKKFGEKNTTIERIDNSGNYSKENCHWTTYSEQMLNTRHNRLIEFNGEIKPLCQWAQDYKILYATLWRRINKNWPVEKALNTPVKQYA